MTNYKIFYIPYQNPIEQICILRLKDNEGIFDGFYSEHINESNNVEIIIDKFIKNKYKELVYAWSELVLVNMKTNVADFRFGYIPNWDDEKDEELNTLHTSLDSIESSCLYQFSQN